MKKFFFHRVILNTSFFIHLNLQSSSGLRTVFGFFFWSCFVFAVVLESIDCLLRDINSVYLWVASADFLLWHCLHNTV